MFTTTQLIEAVRDGDTENMGTLLAANPAAVNTVLEENCTLLQFAAEIGHLDMCRFLLRAGADLNTPPGPNSPYSSALQAAASGGFFDIVKTLAISKDADVNGRGPGGGGKNALEAAAEGGFLDVVMFLVEEAGAEVDFPHVDGGTLGTTALRAAAGTGREDVVRYLVAKGAAINATSGYSQETALNSAVEEGNDEIVEILVGCGADLDIAPMFGVTAIETAAMHGRFSTVMILLQAKGNTPDLSAAALRAAAAAGEIDIAKLILGMGKINVNSASEYGHTALHVAVLKGRLDLVDLFLGEHASTEVRDAEDKTPLLLALESSDPNMDIIRSLLDKGARSKGVSAENIQALLQPAGLQFVCLREGPTGRNNIIMAVHDDDPDLPPDRYLDPNRNPELRHITMPPTRYL